MKTTAIIQSRMGSKRLPGKALKPLAGKPLINHLLARVDAAKEIDQIVVATGDQPIDDPLVAHCEQLGIPVFRGSAHDVLDRYVQAADHSQADNVVRLTGDNPLLDPRVIDLVVGYYKAHASQFDLVSNTQDRSFPRGMDVEVFSKEALERAASEASDPFSREHVTPYFYDHPENFRLGRLELRLTVDTEEDVELIEHLLGSLPENDYRLADIVDLLQQHPEWISINGHYVQEGR